MKNVKFEKTERKNVLSLSIATLAIAGLLGGSASFVSAASFADNTLVRSDDGTVFVIRQGEKVKINSLDDLRRDFRGKKIVNIDDKTLASIRTSSGNSGSNSTSNKKLIRTADGKIFEIKNGERRPVSSLDELRGKFRNVPITNVDFATLNSFPLSSSGSSGRAFDDNSLIRTSKGQIFSISGNSLRKVANLDDLRRNHSGKAIRNVSNDDLIANGIKLRGDGTIDDNSTLVRSSDDFVNGVKLRGDGTVDDNSPRHSGQDDSVNGINLRGDGSVDDNTPRHSGSDDSGRSGGSSGRGSTDD